MNRTAFVTGATGFVGLNLVQALIAQGWDVTALHRASSDLQFLLPMGSRLAAGEITDPASLLRALPHGCDTVFHVAGNTSMWRAGNAQQTLDNVEGTRCVVEACIAQGVRRLVVTSSISAYGPVSGEVTEVTPSLAPSSWVNYQKTKWQAQELARAATLRGLEVVILQPAGIIGPYDLGTWGRLFGLVQRGKLPGVPPGGRSFAHVREVVAAHIAAATRGTSGEHYILAGTNARILELVQTVAQLLGKPVATRETPAAVLKAVAAAADFASRFTGKEPTLTPEIAYAFGHDITASATKAQRELSFQIVPLQDMLQDCHAWLTAQGRL